MDQDIKSAMSDELRWLRKSNVLSIEELSESTGISVATLYRIENSKCNNLDILSKLLKFYNVSYLNFFKKICASMNK